MEHSKPIFRKASIGILLAALYGFVFRLIFEIGPLSEETNSIFVGRIFSITFLFVLPIIIAYIPFLIAREEMAAAPKSKQFLYPILSVYTFLGVCVLTGLEDMICFMILFLPLSVVAGIAGLLLGQLLPKKSKREFLTLLILPLLFASFESQIPEHYRIYEVESKIIIDATKAEVWEHIIEVPEITSEEYNRGFFNYMGIPRPVKSELKKVNGTQYRIGYFSDDLQLYEKISDMDSLRYVAFEIDLAASKLRDLPTDKHVLKGGYFEFGTIAYSLEAVDSETTELILSCSYSIESSMNLYANFWAKHIIKDFEVKLLGALKSKIEG